MCFCCLPSPALVVEVLFRHLLTTVFVPVFSGCHSVVISSSPCFRVQFLRASFSSQLIVFRFSSQHCFASFFHAFFAFYSLAFIFPCFSFSCIVAVFWRCPPISAFLRWYFLPSSPRHFLTITLLLSSLPCPLLPIFHRCYLYFSFSFLLLKALIFSSQLYTSLRCLLFMAVHYTPSFPFCILSAVAVFSSTSFSCSILVAFFLVSTFFDVLFLPFVPLSCPRCLCIAVHPLLH